MLNRLKTLKNDTIGSLSCTRNTRLVWGWLAVLAVLDIWGLHKTGIHLADGTLTLVFVMAALMAALSFAYTYIRRDARIAALGHLAAVLLLFSAGTEIGSYIATAMGGPLIDAQLAAADAALGFDWPGYYNAIAAHPWLHIGLIIAYWCPPGQMVLLLVVLGFFGRIDRMWEMMWLFMLIATASVVLSGLFPAAGAFAYFNVQAAEPYVTTFNALRVGTLKVIDKDTLQGIIQFPSLHISWVIIYTYAARGVRFLFPLLLAVNLLVAIATPPVGGHHLADLLGGAVVTLLAILLVRQLAARGVLPQRILPGTTA